MPDDADFDKHSTEDYRVMNTERSNKRPASAVRGLTRDRLETLPVDGGDSQEDIKEYLLDHSPRQVEVRSRGSSRQNAQLRYSSSLVELKEMRDQKLKKLRAHTSQKGITFHSK